MDLVHIILYTMLIIENIFCVSLQHEIKGKHSRFNWIGMWEKVGDLLAEKKVTLS